MLHVVKWYLRARAHSHTHTYARAQTHARARTHTQRERVGGRERRKLQTLVYDILPWRKVPESDARSVGETWTKRVWRRDVEKEGGGKERGVGAGNYCFD